MSETEITEMPPLNKQVTTGTGIVSAHLWLRAITVTHQQDGGKCLSVQNKDQDISFALTKQEAAHLAGLLLK